MTIDEVILKRGSARRFSHEPISSEALTTMLEAITHGIDADFLSPGERLNDLYVIVNAVDGVEPGAYHYDGELHPLKAGNFRGDAGYLDLEQALAADAAVNVYFLADLPAVLKRYGNRGYRCVQLEAGILGGKLYLAAYALGLGATGLTFYDDDVIAFFSPHAKGKSAIFLVAVGHPAKRKPAVT